MWMTTLIVFAAGNAVAFALGAYLWRAGTITIGTVYIIFYYTELLQRPIEELRHELDHMQQAFAGIARVQELLGVQSALRDGTSRVLPDGTVPEPALQVTASSVHMAGPPWI